ncbi:MAG: Digeranylgeranylglyceryl phosphate synthase [Methanomassiliicoccales archaeon PtaB.Bin134]|nr:MAG: Digeranylgeranylglyceryl phosphate synthase [Methanomassiliicoccales archaeon PtaB.Bin134]
MEKVRSLLGLLKPELPVAAGICVIVGQALALGEAPEAWPALFGFLIGFLISGAEMVSNDLFDLEVDRVNHPDRPLPSGRVSVPEVAAFTAILSAAGLSIAASQGPLVLAFTVLIWILGLLYNWRLKRLGLPGNAIVALSVGMTFVLGGMMAGRPDSGLVWTFAIMASLFDLAEEVSGGVMDAEGDALIGSRSIARLYGRRAALSLVTLLFVSFMALGTVPFIVGWLGWYYLLLIIVADAAVAYLVVKLWRSSTPEEGRSVQRTLYLTMTLFIVAIFLVVIL